MTTPHAAIPDDLVRTILEVHGKAGSAWLERLPATLDECAEMWGLSLDSPFDCLSYNYVARGDLSNGMKAVLKAGPPCAELRTEIAALRHYDGSGAAMLLEFDAELGVMLLERLEPGSVLSSVPDDREAVNIASGVMQRLRKPLPQDHAFPSVADWTCGLNRLRVNYGGTTGPLPVALVEEAESLSRELLASMSDRVLLHGDLHHSNILSAEREPWLAIDPKGVVGEPACEVAAYLRNVCPQPTAVLARRVNQFSEELGIERERVRGWGVVLAVLSAWWMIEDHGRGWEGSIACAERLASI